MQQELLNWISQQQNHLDEIIAKTADIYLENNKNCRSNFIFDIQEANQEKYALSQGKDLCYDRPSVGFVYSLWYHGRRINTFITYLINVFYKNQEKEVAIFDLGAGTGAVQWAIGVIYAGMKLLNIPTPKLKIINIDNSPFMLEYHQLLWKQFVIYYNECSDISWEYKINCWSNSETSDHKNYWICASYLFDSNEHQDLIAKDFISLIQISKPSNILLLTSDQPKKRKFLDSISEEIKICGYETDETYLKNPLFDGIMTAVTQHREQYQRQLNIKGLTGKAQWKDYSFTGKIFRTITLIDIPQETQNIQSIDIYTPPTKQRKQIDLSESQKKASKHSHKPTIITGSAGSGKSIVITERIKNLVEQNDYNPSLNILLTTFNKGLMGQLGDWLEEILDPNKFIRKIDYSSQGEIEDTSKFYFNSSTTDSPNITLMHFDILPTRIGRILGKIPYEKYSLDRINQIINEVKDIYKPIKKRRRGYTKC
jgi:DNA helicase-2/ATP-dependent DNA helicase PcrA